MRRLRPSHLTMLALVILIAALSGAVYVYWHEIMLAVVGLAAWRLAWRRLLGSSPRGRRRRSRLDSVRKWIEAGSAVAIAANTRKLAPKRETIRPRPEPVYRVPSSQVAADDPRWDTDPHWPFRGPQP